MAFKVEGNITPNLSLSVEYLNLSEVSIVIMDNKIGKVLARTSVRESELGTTKSKITNILSSYTVEKSKIDKSIEKWEEHLRLVHERGCTIYFYPRSNSYGCKLINIGKFGPNIEVSYTEPTNPSLSCTIPVYFQNKGEVREFFNKYFVISDDKLKEKIENLVNKISRSFDRGYRVIYKGAVRNFKIIGIIDWGKDFIELEMYDLDKYECEIGLGNDSFRRSFSVDSETKLKELVQKIYFVDTDEDPDLKDLINYYQEMINHKIEQGYEVLYRNPANLKKIPIKRATPNKKSIGLLFYPFNDPTIRKDFESADELKNYMEENIYIRENIRPLFK